MPRLESVALCRGCRASLRTILEVHCCVHYYPHMVRLVTRRLVGVIDGVNDDRQRLQLSVRGGPEDGSPREVTLVQSVCRVHLQL